MGGAAIHSRRLTGLEARHCKPQCLNVLCEIKGRVIAGATGWDLRVGAEVDAAAEERAGGEHHGPCAEAAPVGRPDARDARAVREQAGDHSLRELQPRKSLEQRPHGAPVQDRKSTRLNSSHSQISYAVFCLKKKKKQTNRRKINSNLDATESARRT